jgi:hypothetical protein
VVISSDLLQNHLTSNLSLPPYRWHLAWGHFPNKSTLAIYFLDQS